MPAKRLVDYHDSPEPAQLHPLWKHWLVHARDTVPTDKDIYMWEVEQARLRRRLKEIDAASNKMRSEEAADRERGGNEMANMIARLSSQLSPDMPRAQSKASMPQETKMPDFDLPPQPEPGSNLAFENGIQIIPKDTKPYSPDPSRLKSILQAKKTEEPPAPSHEQDVGVPKSSWSPNTTSKNTNLDDL
jgi:hypothetical protein